MTGAPPWGTNGAPGPAASRRSRRSQQLTRQQRLVISVVAAALGLLFAWVVQGGGRHHRPPTRVVQEGPLLDASQAGGQQIHGLPKAVLAAQVAEQFVSIQRSASKADSGGTVDTNAGHEEGAQQTQAMQHSQQQQQQQAQSKGQQQQQQPAVEQEMQQAVQQQAAAQLPGMEDERDWFNRLSPEACTRAEHLRVCSHRGRVAVDGVPHGSLSAYSVLHKGGVSCYDIDFVQTRDGQLVASHPEDLAMVVAAAGPNGSAAAQGQGRQGAQSLGQWSLAELRAAGANEERFPTADALIKVFAALLEQSGLLWRPKPGQGQHQPDYEQLPVLLMDLKTEAFNADTINSVAAAAQAVDAEAHVALFVATTQQLALVHNQTRWGGPLIGAYMDQDNPNPPVTPEALEPFALLGPSIKMADSFFAAAAQLGKPVLAWTVDTPQELHRALEANLNAVISNCPLAVRGVLLDWRDRCTELQGRLKERRQHKRQHRRALQVQQGAGQLDAASQLPNRRTGNGE